MHGKDGQGMARRAREGLVPAWRGKPRRAKARRSKSGKGVAMGECQQVAALIENAMGLLFIGFIFWLLLR